MATLDDVNAQIDQNIADRNMRQYADPNLLGGDTANQQGLEELQGEAVPFSEDVKAAFRSQNAAVGFYQYLQRKGIARDPDYNFADHQDELMKGVPLDYLPQMANTQSLDEALLLRNDIMNEVHDTQLLSYAGAKGFAASALAGIMDVDTPLTFLSGGSYLGEKTAAGLAKVGLTEGRIASSLTHAAQGLEAGTAVQAVNSGVRPTGDWTDVPYAGLSGLALGAVGGALMTHAEQGANDAFTELRREFDKASMEGSNGIHDFSKDDPVTPAMDTSNTPADFDYRTSVGAAARQGIRTDTFDLDASSNTEMKATRAAVLKQFIDNGVYEQEESAFNATPSGKASERFHSVLANSPLASDFDKVWNSGSVIGQGLAYNLLESPVGLVRNNKSAPMLQRQFFTQIARPVMLSYPELFDQWAAKTKLTDKILARYNPGLRKEFEQGVMSELMARRFDGDAYKPHNSPAVVSMADRIDEAAKNARVVLQGRANETAVLGADTELDGRKGWFRQRWRGDKIQEAIKSGRATRDSILTALRNTYTKSYPDWTPEMSDKMAKAVVRRSIAMERGIDTNLISILNHDGSAYLREFLTDNGFSVKEADSVVDSLRGLNADKGKPGFLRNRAEVDMREQIPGTDMRLMDIMDTDILGNWSHYANQASGLAAAARKGIHVSRVQDYVNMINDELEASGKPPLNADQLGAVNAMFAYYRGGQIGEGVNPWVRRMIKLTNLSLLNGLGLTQMAEAGVQIAAVGWERWYKTLTDEAKRMYSGEDIPALKELSRHMMGIDGEHLLYREDLMLRHLQNDPQNLAELGHFMDGLLNVGARVQGYISGFYKVKQLQTRVAIRNMLFRLNDHFTGKKEIPEARLRDLGLNPATEKRLSEYFKQGVEEKRPEADFVGPGQKVTVGADSNTRDVLNLHLDKWRPEDVEDLVAVLHRQAAQVVQEVNRGESSYWMNSTVGAVLGHLKLFTLVSMQKQLLRNTRIMDAETQAGALFSMLTAGAVYAAQQTIQNKDKNKNLNPVGIMRGAVNLSNYTGWLPQFSDPVMTMLGLDDLRFQQYGSTGAGGTVVGVPPVFPTLDRVAKIPGAVQHAVTGNLSSNDIYNLQATPLIGNLYGMTAVFNQMKSDLKDERRQEYRAKLHAIPEKNSQPLTPMQGALLAPPTEDLKALQEWARKNNQP